MADGELLSLRASLSGFARATETQSQAHIKPLHRHIAARLVIEGGFRPDEITPRPPLRIESKGSRWLLHHDPSRAAAGELTILGGLKTKQVDIVVSKPGIGPCLAISVKGTLNAFRNLTNRMEEAVGDCTNLHITYPALVYGFMHVLRANREGEVPQRNDIAVHSHGDVGDDIKRYHNALSGLVGRLGVRDDFTRYEAVALALVDTGESTLGEIFAGFPLPESALAIERFFPALYQVYDLRYVYGAPALASSTRRLEWSKSPALDEICDQTQLSARLAAN